MKIIAIISLFLLVAGCAGKQRAAESTFPAACERLYVLLPENYVIDLAAGSTITLNSSAHEFVVFCSPAEASAARKKALAEGILSGKNNWLIFALAGEPSELAMRCHENGLCLRNSANVEDWVRETGEEN